MFAAVPQPVRRSSIIGGAAAHFPAAMSAGTKRKLHQTSLVEGTTLSTMSRQDVNVMNEHFAVIAAPNKLADRMLKLLHDQKGLSLGCQVDLFEHAVQTATLCFDDLKAKTDSRLAAREINASELLPS